MSARRRRRPPAKGSPQRETWRAKVPRLSFVYGRRVLGHARGLGLRRRGLQKLPGIGSGRRLVDVDVWNDGSTGEQSVLVRVVSFEVNPDRQPLYDFDEVARGILRRQQRQRRSGPHRKAGDPALEYVPAAIHVDIEIGGLADA